MRFPPVLTHPDVLLFLWMFLNFIKAQIEVGCLLWGLVLLSYGEANWYLLSHLWTLLSVTFQLQQKTMTSWSLTLRRKGRRLALQQWPAAPRGSTPTQKRARPPPSAHGRTIQVQQLPPTMTMTSSLWTNPSPLVSWRTELFECLSVWLKTDSRLK